MNEILFWNLFIYFLGVAVFSFLAGYFFKKENENYSFSYFMAMLLWPISVPIFAFFAFIILFTESAYYVQNWVRANKK